MFNVDPQEIDVAHDRAGHADIELEYKSLSNPRFILHDSKGFEAGSTTNWDNVDRFLRRCQAYPELSRRIHAIWLCLLTPRPGARLLEAGDENLLKLAIELKIPIVAVFTKYDLLVNSFLLKDRSSTKSKPERLLDSEKKASESLRSSGEGLERIWQILAPKELPMAWVKMSLPKKPDPKMSTEMLSGLADVTREKLREVESNLYITWITAQQVNARQKVDLSIDEGLKKYWQDLGKSIAFEGQTMINCIRRIHDDILKVWNFRDPDRVLSSAEFFSQMIGLVAPLIDDQPNQAAFFGDGVSTVSDLVTIIQAAGATALALPLSAISLGGLAIKFLYGKYQQYDSTAKFLAGYIVNLTLFLHGIFMDILPSDPPRALSHSFVTDALALRRSDLQRNSSDNINSTPEGITTDINARLGLR
ncbi:hypothetical protein HYPSUDRAFT_859131 [Hypholoma sublateritium FD-334 SS-4]|uniref:G domain-containing protein n=1 Tax=Hypholoma sublateritium (strain FD-334 SS-4) TaxID=945553 RepID=A0A0D2PHM3_HYPSF|nr:hypothetical protein HYPSUDRAFT_859131 [Hypholoma sublateritium FD-334 SS-4]